MIRLENPLLEQTADNLSQENWVQVPALAVT